MSIPGGRLCPDVPGLTFTPSRRSGALPLIALVCCTLAVNFARADTTPSPPAGDGAPPDRGPTQTPADDPPEDDSVRAKIKRGVNSVMEHDITRKVIGAGKTAADNSRKAVRNVTGSNTSRENRTETRYSVVFMPLSFGILLPEKNGVAGNWILSDRWTLEAEYLKGDYNLGYFNVDLLELSERIISVNARWYPGNSFNLKFGGGERKYTFALGSDYVTKITNGEVSMGPSIEVTNQVLLLGIGNRWQWSRGFTLGADWFELIAPVRSGSVHENVSQHVKAEDDQHNLNKVYTQLRRGWTFNALKVHVGYSF